MNLKKLQKKLKAQPKKEKNPKLLSTGSTLLNCQCSGDPLGGWMIGKYHLAVGDSSSGKTALALTCLAEASIDKRFDDYELVHDDIEGGNLFNIKKLFGKKLAKRLKTVHSTTSESLYYNIDDFIKAGRPFIYIVDSSDGLDTEENEAKFQKKKKAYKKKKAGEVVADVSGSYGTSKAKMHSTNLPRLVSKLREMKSIVIIICQTRDNIGFGSIYGDKSTHSGGKALKFYATLQVWSTIKKRLRKKVRGKNKTIGIISKINVKKNRINGQEGSVEVPIYYSLGFDDLGSCVDFLVENKHWKKASGKIKAVEFDFVGTKEKLISMIEENELRRKLQKIVGVVWDEIEQESRVKRKSKYA